MTLSLSLSLSLSHAFSLDVELAPPIDVGDTYLGVRRVIPIIGGRFHGPRMKGEILPGGADWNVVRPDGVVHLWARYTLRTNDGVAIMITNEGFQRGPADTMARILAGQPFDQSEWYARTRPVFEVGDARYAWLNQAVFIGDLRPPSHPLQVSIDIHEVL